MVTRSSTRLLRVDTPIIPTIASLVRDNPGTISLGQGVVRWAPPADLLAKLPDMMADPLLHRYQAVGGLAPLVDALAVKLKDENAIDVRSGALIQVTAGSNMAFLQAVLAVGDPGDEFILPVPFFFNQEMAIRMAGCVPVCVASRKDHQLDLDAIRQAITARTRAIITVSPNNPTGAVYPEADLRAVNELCAQHGLLHFSDEAYEYFTFEGARHFSAASLPGAERHTLTFQSFSKGWGMASWRCGYVVYPAALADAMNKVQDTNLICAPVASQLLALELLKQGRQWLEPHLQALAAVRQQVHESLGGIGALASFAKTEGGFYVMVKLPGIKDAMAFSRAMVERHRVAAIPGFAFGLTDTADANFQRLSFGSLDAQTVAEGVARFVSAVRDWYRH